MAKKFVRGITDIKDINKQDFDTNNVNDLLSDGQYNYIHRKKGKGEEYHNLTDNIKTISSDNTDLLTVTNNNKTTNTATLHPKHDAQKEQVLESTRNTISIHHGENGTAEKTTVDTNPQKVLEHENLLTGYGLRKDTSNNQTTITMDTGSVTDGFDLNNFNSGLARASYFTNAPYDNVPFYVVALGSVTGSVYQIAFKRLNSNDEINQMFIRTKMVGTNNWSDWKQYGMDSDTLNTILAGKQNKLTAGDGITIQGNTISATGGAHDSQKEQVLESTRSTIAINHGTNGTAEKTTVDTNPKKVLEHENLISDSEYITLNHQTGENVTHIKTAALKEKLDDLEQTKQDVLTAGTGITIQDQTIGLRTIDNYSGDLNNITYTCIAKPTDNAVHLPGLDDGILTVVKIRNTVSQKYHSTDNIVYTRVGQYHQGVWTWTPWVKLTTLAV